MKRKHIVLIAAIAVMISAAGFSSGSRKLNSEILPMAPKDHQLTIKKISGEWKVVLTQDPTKKVKAKRKDKITWNVEGTDVFFQFMDEGLFGTFKTHGKKNKKVTLTIKDNTAFGTYGYAVFCLEDSTFATGNSPPEIIIEE